MRSRSTILLAIGVLLSVVTAGGLYFYAASQRGPAGQAQAATDMVSAIVARADIPARTVVTAEMLTRQALPAAAIPASAARAESEVVGQTSLAPIPAGSMLLRPQLSAAGGKTGLSVALDPGKVLVAFPTTDPLTNAGLVAPGDHIDLLATVTTGTGETSRKTQTTIQNLEVVQVLAPAGGGKALTFVVDHQVALFLKYLRDSQASIEVAVRSQGENDVIRTQSVNVQVLQDTFGFR
jgi:pilus assembly protein CpaB